MRRSAANVLPVAQMTVTARACSTGNHDHVGRPVCNTPNYGLENSGSLLGSTVSHKITGNTSVKEKKIQTFTIPYCFKNIIKIIKKC